MKTSVIKVPDMLSVLTVDEVERRFGEVPGVESATVNHAAGNVTVRFDETMLDVADITVFVHQRGQRSAGEMLPKDGRKSASDHPPEVEPATASASPHGSAVPKADSPPAALSASTTPAADSHADGPPSGAPPSPAGA